MDNKILSRIHLLDYYYSTCTLISLLLFSIFLCSCSSHVSRQDGPPNFYVDETKIPNAVPKPEPLAKFGNMSSYVVFGKRYYPMKSSRYYEAIGTASWYGTKFHTRLTSSGEPYNMLSMTAAHKTLPLPTYVEVTNLKNSRKIIVKVNDRGPFESNRLIDLSYVAAKKLGMLGHGTTLVKVKAIDPYFYAQKNNSSWHLPTLASHSSSKPTGESVLLGKNVKQHHPSLYLQVGAFRNKIRAEKLQQRLMALLTTPVRISNPTAKINLYRVKIGPFRDVATAERISYKLKGMGIKPNKTDGA